MEHGSMRMTLPEDLPLRQTRWGIKHPMSMTVSEGNDPASTEWETVNIYWTMMRWGA